MLARCALVRFQAGDVVYRMGDEPGGIYGLISGNLTLNTAPADRIPRLIQTAQVGLWAGEDCFLGRQPRRVQLQVRVPTVMMHLPLAEMDRLAAANPEAVRYFAQILMSTVDSLVRITSDLQRSRRNPASPPFWTAPATRPRRRSR